MSSALYFLTNLIYLIFFLTKYQKWLGNIQQALCVVQSPTSEEEPLGHGGHHFSQTVDGSTMEESAGRCGTPPTSGSHRQSRRRRPPSTEPLGNKTSGRTLAPPPSTTPVKSHYKVDIYITYYIFLFRYIVVACVYMYTPSRFSIFYLPRVEQSVVQQQQRLSSGL